MPFVNIRIVKEVIASDPAGKKQRIAEGVVSAINEAAGIPKDDIWVVFDEVNARDWFVGEAHVARRKGFE